MAAIHFGTAGSPPWGTEPGGLRSLAGECMAGSIAETPCWGDSKAMTTKRGPAALPEARGGKSKSKSIPLVSV
jgi:hypothetical protein